MTLSRLVVAGSVAVALLFLGGCLQQQDDGTEGMVDHFSNPPTLQSDETKPDMNLSQNVALVSWNTTVTAVHPNGTFALAAETEGPPRRLANVSLVGRGPSAAAGSPNISQVDSACVQDAAADANKTLGSLVGMHVVAMQSNSTGKYHLFFVDTGRPVAGELLAQGFAVYTGSEGQPDAQVRARGEKLGIWACAGAE